MSQPKIWDYSRVKRLEGVQPMCGKKDVSVFAGSVVPDRHQLTWAVTRTKTPISYGKCEFRVAKGVHHCHLKVHDENVRATFDGGTV